jgi:3-hydroxyacyl-[acyl-carrier-protein] dehydratase
MPPPPLLDLAELDFEHPLADRAAIERVNPHRHEFALLDGVLLIDIDRKRVAGWHDVRFDAFWVRGHIPGRPLFPGVMMVEATAQLASYVYHHKFPHAGFMGFAAANEIKFRGAVEPPARFVIVGEPRQLKPRRFVCYMQGFVNNVMVYEGVLTGMPV